MSSRDPNAAGTPAAGRVSARRRRRAARSAWGWTFPRFGGRNLRAAPHAFGRRGRDGRAGAAGPEVAARATNRGRVSDVDFLRRLHPNPAPLLLELEQQGRYDGVWCVDREVGRLLSTLVHAMQANRILEIGTGYGYATLWMALAMPPAGRLWTIDPDGERVAVAREYLRRADCDDFVEVLEQPALEVLPTFPTRNLDIVFIDAEMTEYEKYLELVVPLLKRSGLVILDNLLSEGLVSAEPSASDTAETKSVRAFDRVFLAHPQLDATILPIGDGLGIGARVE